MMHARPEPPPAAALRAAQALRAFGSEYKRWVDSRLPRDTNITPARLQVLTMLTQHSPCTMITLSRRLGTTAHNVTKLVDWLETEGLVERHRNPSDRRTVMLHITGSGSDAEKRLAQAHANAVAEAFTDLSDPELDQLTALLDRLRTAIRHRLD
jgi:DNA-binding MarR family transcriptional regulator